MTTKKEHKIITAEAASARFFRALCSDGVEPLVRLAAELFECPVLLTDENYRLICQYPKKRLGQDIWDALYDYGALPLEVVQEYQNAYLQMSQKIYEPFYADWGLTEEFPRIFGEVYTESQRILGHIAIFFMDRDFCPENLETAQIFIDALRIRMSQKSISATSNLTYLIDLLDSEVSSQRKLLASRILGERLKGAFCLMVTSVGNTAAQRAFAASVIGHLNNTFRSTVSTLYNDCIVTLFGEMSGRAGYTDKERRFLNSVAEILKKSCRGIGVSVPFTNFTEINSYFYQAYLAAELKQAAAAFFQDVAPAPVFLPALQLASGEAYMHPALLQIWQYDKENGTEYFRTLKLYTLSMHNKDKAAQELCIHRNTLLYRLNRIQDIFCLPFEESQTSLYLLNSFQIWDLMDREG